MKLHRMHHRRRSRVVAALAALPLLATLSAPNATAEPASPGSEAARLSAAPDRTGAGEPEEGTWFGKPVLMPYGTAKDDAMDRAEDEAPRNLTANQETTQKQAPPSGLKRWEMPGLEARGEPLSAAEAGRRALAAAEKAGARSYADTSKVPLTGDGDGDGDNPTPRAAAELTPPTKWGATPPATIERCLDREEAGSTKGKTFNRWLWCQKGRLGLEYFKVINGRPELQGITTVAFRAAAVGAGKTRGVRTYLQVEEDSLDNDVWSLWDRLFTVPSLRMNVLSDCAEPLEYCWATGSGIEHTWEEWEYRDDWMHWDVRSDESAGRGRDKVSYDRWHFRVDGSGGGYKIRPARSEQHTIRCDSADYFAHFGERYPRACVNYEVVPNLRYKISDDRVTGVAQHIRTAQNMPERTYPIEFDRKDIPGKYYPGQRNERGLHRVPYGGLVARSNEDYKDDACKRQGPYAGSRGLPPYDTNTKDCDEYPFQSTEEGASSHDWAFSVRAVPKSENTAAGSLLRWYYFSDRVLYDNDEFWVNIQD
ncbi:hypothetical protein FE633_20955 [Streptomyces montanus]|uniref:Deoxyribonuclease NucA/NucB domain-containing protein n=1 Tax=Streptomyces montanus TaxID=2580423 RepID=A0A5R9FS71_9ACTN|nr:NucA/NucB deoxyribonuclease domain-containing protein [Streptomyces montanus]TLS44238.1 hypothetical protein FE633_20955 [Streptomyces montanus]